MFEGAALDLEEELDRANEEVARAQRHLLAVIRRASDAGIWRRSGARNLAHWLSMRYGVASWKANRWIAAARALEVLPAIDEAFSSGRLSIDKTVELSRFATREDERALIRWASDVSCATVRRRADRVRVRWAVRRDPDGEVRWITLDGERYRSGPRAPALTSRARRPPGGG